MSERSTIPCVRGLPLLGNLLELRRDPGGLLRRVLAEHGDVGAFRAGPRRVVVIASAEHARTVLVDEADAFEKGPVIRAFSREVLGDGLLRVESARHKPRRRAVAPAFGPRALERYAEAMAEVARDEVAALRDGAIVDLHRAMTRLGIRVVGRTLFSVDLRDEQSSLSEAFAIVLRWVTRQIGAAVPLPLSLPLPAHRRVRAAIARLDATLYELIDRRRRGGDRPPDFLSHMVDARDDEGRPLSDRHIRDEAMTFFLAGHETSANALAWSLYLLLRHREAWARVREEARGGVLFSSDAPARLPFAVRVFQEAMRLYPPVHSLGRQSTRAVRLGPHVLPAGSIVIVSPFLMHRRAAYFPDPDRFDPDRFLRPIPKFAYLPFAAGPRACIGGQFATIEAAIVLGTLARAVDLEAIDPAPIAPELLVTMRPAKPVLARVARR